MSVDTRNLLLAVLVTLGTMLVAWPFAEGGYIDDFAFISPCLFGRAVGTVASVDFSLTAHPYGYYLAFSCKFRVFSISISDKQRGP